MPGRRVAPSQRDEVEVAKLRRAVLGVGDRAVIKVGDELLEVVVAEAEEQADARALQPLPRQLHPCLGAGDDQLTHRPLGEVLVGFQALDEGGVGAERIAAHGGDTALEVLELAVVLEREVAPAEPSGAVHDRHHLLAREVSAHDQDLDAVELPGVHELAEAGLGAVDVRDKKELHPRRLYVAESR